MMVTVNQNKPLAAQQLHCAQRNLVNGSWELRGRELSQGRITLYERRMKRGKKKGREKEDERERERNN